MCPIRGDVSSAVLTPRSSITRHRANPSSSAEENASSKLLPNVTRKVLNMHLNSSKRRKSALRRKEAVAYVKHVREFNETTFPTKQAYMELLRTIKKFQ